MADRAPRFYVDGSLDPGTTIDLPPDRARQIATVLRLSAGDGIVLFNGDGHNYRSTIAAVNRKAVSVHIDDRSPGPPDIQPEIRLAQALIKSDRFDWVVQKAVELGVTRITPVATERTVVSLSADRAQARRDRWRRIAIEAAEQSGRTQFPEIDQIHSLDDMLRSPNSGFAVALWEGEDRLLLPEALDGPPGPLSLVVGPEGGFSDVEVAEMRAAGARLASLGPLTLRSETAAIAGIASIRALADAVHCGRAWGQNVRISPA